MEKSNIQKSIMQANVNAMNRVATKRERERLEKPHENFIKRSNEARQFADVEADEKVIDDYFKMYADRFNDAFLEENKGEQKLIKKESPPISPQIKKKKFFGRGWLFVKQSKN
jgi:hypothetical protein